MTLLFAFGLCALTLLSLRGGLVPEAGLKTHSFDQTGLALGVLAFGAAVLYLGPLYGVAITLGVLIHEFGHVAAFRVAGHRDARFRLIPLLGGVAISNRAPDSDLKDFFITLMGPGICLAPTVLAYVLALSLWNSAPDFAYAAWVFAIANGALNFVNLLPFWPLDGGRCVHLLARCIWPPLAPWLAIAMAAALALAALWMQSVLLFLVAALGAQGLQSSAKSDANTPRPAMTKAQGAQALAAYLCTLGVHLIAGLPILLRLI
ncbi:metalloprotease [Alphaproteobacteria bacterium KMM 3653]|uniref:Metalloprotease n=1 Tax=Harenicola maris TaxID=2841044 RepID=A0AAP2CRC8_9RHOB|nr:metalloprotease [Harenicola maris]